ncbi:hypothetical protein CU097_003597 [Rhizopus azygosporus]|uniref:Uncharacterized protein n=1 Tax=Rhizopus azygosporus TaxID=86630 RepID=A0A367JX69_RHIAZ|nr:hypothetical protein CU097_003597 [Rhizopus azygosporus]
MQWKAAAINPSERQQPCRADVSIALNSTHRDIEDDEAAIDDYDQFFDEEESNRLDQNFLDDDNNGSNPSDLTMAYHPGRENEYYLQHHNDGDNNSNFVSPYDNQEAHDHRTAYYPSNDDGSNDHSDVNSGHDGDEDRHDIVEHDERTFSDDLFPNSIWVATDGTNLAEL